MIKVYCYDCKHHRHGNDGNIKDWCVYGELVSYPLYKIRYYANPLEKNENNDCVDYEATLHTNIKMLFGLDEI